MSGSPTRFGVPAVAAALAVALAGCATMRVRSFVESGTTLTQYRTYGWAPARARSTGDARLDSNEFFDERVRTAVDRGLAGRGFEQARGGAPDLLVRYHASITQQIDLGSDGSQSAYRGDLDERPFVYDAGTLVVDLVDTRTDTLVWRGWAEGSFEGAIDNQRWMEARIDEAVTKILRRLPERRLDPLAPAAARR